MQKAVGSDVQRAEAWTKVTGSLKYNGDDIPAGCLHARLLTSTYAHAKLRSIDTIEAMKTEGVHAIVTGADCDVLTGSIIRDMPVLARDKARYYGEPLAIAVADEEWQAALAVQKIKVAYAPLPVVNSPTQARQSGAPLVHEDLANYKMMVEGIRPKPGTNIAHEVKIRKGNMETGWSQSQVTLEGHFTLPQAGHAYMETRNARAGITPDGTVRVFAATQGPHASRKLIADHFKLRENSVVVTAPCVGGGFGGKVNTHPEMMAYIASRAVGGRTVNLTLTREESFLSSPCKIGAEMHVKIGATERGELKALQVEYLVDTGAYGDTGPVMTRAAAANCTGVYNVENVSCDAFCLYTNHVYATSFRGFGHDVSTFAIECMLDRLADKLNMDPMEIRIKNALKEDDTTPTQVKVTLANTGNVLECIARLKTVMKWDEGLVVPSGENRIRVKGMACFSKTSSSPTDATAGAVVTFCSDGTVNLNCAIIECGPGMHTVMKQLLAEKLMADVDAVTINERVDTQLCPEHWKTVASMSTYMVGKAVIKAADDVIRQLKEYAALALRCAPDDVALGPGRMYLIEDPSIFVPFKDLVYGVKYPDGNAVGGQIIGRGSFIMKHLSKLDPETGKGRTGPHWTVGAQAVEVEYDAEKYTYRLIKAATVLDSGKTINPYLARGQVMGGMNMGVGLATREHYSYDNDGKIEDSSLRTYKVVHFGENPQYYAEFAETPNPDAPYGLRGLGEEGVLGIPAAFANAMSRAAGVSFDSLPITYEKIWRTKTGGAL